MKYYLESMGCQMNTADSQHLASELEKLGHRATATPHDADIMVVNTCVVRQSAEDKAFSRLGEFNVLKQENPDRIIAVMGCLVGVQDALRLRKRVPYVDVFMSPSDPQPMVDFLHSRMDELEVLQLEAQSREQRDALQDGEILLPAHEYGSLISAHVPVVYGCSHACSFCIIPRRRGVERSRSVGEIVNHVRSLAQQGVREITLLGQIVDRYGKDIPDGPDLADLLRLVHGVTEDTGLERIRFLTSHPNWMTNKILDTVAELPHLMPVIEVPVQAGDDLVLQNMKRGYTVEQYRKLVDNIRSRIPGAAIHTDVIVGFPGETEAQWQNTYDLLAELKLDKVHLARYSPRPHTVSARMMTDDVPEEEKARRHEVIDEMQAGVLAEINGRTLGQTVPVLVEERHKGRWRGRTPHNKLVFFEDGGDWKGQIADVEITWTGPWSMQGRLRSAVSPMSEAFPIPILANDNAQNEQIALKS
ncbi:MAG: tRNA (N6-isopentenyl adenosine(37)-C2)-methylthiotransferase MiaB [Chloroflexi bacterium]|nr:tRNA (N6-isopentenyl adenosine(37)-C2)-methylthiotransferase MiaB [Chloroflexota bacterium]MCC6891920.1 tRNA (N6-isopentenyl adenosine(37)-C2)-methylthiotransferase MiaB [Anaerolineae bacterium]